jgi:hypothetical protein
MLLILFIFHFMIMRALIVYDILIKARFIIEVRELFQFKVCEFDDKILMIYFDFGVFILVFLIISIPQNPQLQKTIRILLNLH